MDDRVHFYWLVGDAFILFQKSTAFIEDDELGYSDCVLACKLQHIRVTCAFYQNLPIPQEFNNIWSYLERVYATPAFEVSCPSDRDIILYHFEKIDFINDKLRKSAQKAILSIPEDQRSMNIPNSSDAQSPSVENIPSVRLSVRSSMSVDEFDEAMRMHYDTGDRDSLKRKSSTYAQFNQTRNES